MTLSIPNVDQDLDVITLLDDAVPPPSCEWRAKEDPNPCGRRATWIMSLSCGHSYYECDVHGEVMKIATATPGRIACSAPGSPKHNPFVPVDVRFDRIAS